ncbi:hypothetical protein ACFVGN_25375 [Streptomyces sp. NPDC057757]|uniref:hypothetical protein n=1 Tax=Streptomyces sp. NPDC057757 TaxID=3346241 RepID=UPI003687A7B6
MFSVQVTRESRGAVFVLRGDLGPAAQERVLRLAAVPDAVARLFSPTGLDQVFSVHADADADQALAAGMERRDTLMVDRDGPAQSNERKVV